MMALTIAGLTSVSPSAQAQSTVVQLNYTNIWKYNISGLELGSAWRTNTYDDSSWSQGQGLFGADDSGIAPYLAVVPTGFLTPFTLSQTVTTYYFRTTFTLTGTSPTATGLQLIATNLIDDGGAIWLNGRLAGTIRMPATFNAATGASGGPTDGQTDTMFLTNFLRAGVNTLAVEVHQPAAASGDLVWGMKLVTVVPTALSITDQPDSQSVFVGEPVALSVGVSGGPVSYRWQKDGTFIQNATNSTFSIASAALTSAGAYRVIVSNAVTVLTSQVAQVTVSEDTVGPKMVSAIIDDGQGSNRVTVRFDETLLNAAPTQKNSPINPANYRLLSAVNNTGYSYSITNVRRSGLVVLLEIGDPQWDPNGSYYLIVNNVADRFTNSINPNSVIGLSVQITENLAQMSGTWNFYDCADVEFCDPNAAAVYANEAFAKTNFVVNPLTWKTGNGIFVKESGLGEIAPCTGDTRGSFLSFQLEPVLFRKTFTRPANSSSTGTLRLRQIFDDGYILYLNGQPIYSNNCVGPISMTSRASGAEVGDAICQTNPVSLVVNNLRPGTNLLAAAVVQHAVNNQADTVFGIELDLVSLQTAQAPTNRPPGTPTITRSRQANQFVLSWPATNYGYALMYSTNIVGTTARPDRNWFTNEANWTQVKDQANPYTNAIPPTTGPRRFYKLFREKLND